MKSLYANCVALVQSTDCRKTLLALRKVRSLHAQGIAFPLNQVLDRLLSLPLLVFKLLCFNISPSATAVLPPPTGHPLPWEVQASQPSGNSWELLLILSSTFVLLQSFPPLLTQESEGFIDSFLWFRYLKNPKGIPNILEGKNYDASYGWLSLGLGARILA